MGREILITIPQFSGIAKELLPAITAGRSSNTVSFLKLGRPNSPVQASLSVGQLGWAFGIDADEDPVARDDCRLVLDVDRIHLLLIWFQCSALTLLMDPISSKWESRQDFSYAKKKKGAFIRFDFIGRNVMEIV